MKKLEEIANKIPTQGGRQIGEVLRKCSSEVPEGLSIVEIGVWLGSGTAQLALGLKGTNKNNPIYCYDKFRVSENEVKKAKEQGMELRLGDDTLPFVKKTLSQFHENIIFIKGNIKNFKYEGPKIGVYIDDASKRKNTFLPIINSLEPFFVYDTKIILMDFFFYEKRIGDIGLKAQFEFMSENKHKYEFIKRISPYNSSALFRYIGGDK